MPLSLPIYTTDEAGNIWLSTNDGGLGSISSNLSNISDLAGCYTSITLPSYATDEAENIWVSTNGGGLDSASSNVSNISDLAGCFMAFFFAEVPLCYIFTIFVLAFVLVAISSFTFSVRGRLLTLMANIRWVLRYTAFVSAPYILRPRQLPSLLFRIATSAFRSVPDVHIVGEMKCGTTALLGYLKQHPGVSASFVKETHFFTGRSIFRADFEDCPDLYRSFFDIAWPQWFTRWMPNCRRLIQIDATPQRLYLSWTAVKVKQMNPKAKIIVCLRDPVDRALSNYMMLVRRGKDKLPNFEQALRSELQRADGREVLRISSAKPLISDHDIIFPKLDFAYQQRGIYIDGVREWVRQFGRKNVLLVDQAELLRDPNAVMARVTTHLGIASIDFKTFVANCCSGKKPRIDARTRTDLERSFVVSNDQLYRDFGFTAAASWNRKYSGSVEPELMPSGSNQK